MDIEVEGVENLLRHLTGDFGGSSPEQILFE
jgi:hypothetical protein